MLLMYLTLRLRLGDLDDDRIISTIVRVVIASGLTALLVQGVKYTVVALGVTLETGFGVLTQLLVSGGIGVVGYLAFATALHLDEVAVIRQWLDRTRRQLVNGVNGSNDRP